MREEQCRGDEGLKVTLMTAVVPGSQCTHTHILCDLFNMHYCFIDFPEHVLFYTMAACKC